MILTLEVIREDIINGDKFYKTFPFMRKDLNKIRFQDSAEALKLLLINIFKSPRLSRTFRYLYREYKTGEDVKRFIKDNILKNKIEVITINSNEVYIKNKIINVLTTENETILITKK